MTPRAHTTSGDLQGTTESGVAVFRGVPYAAAPVGALRFAPPQEIAPWSGLRDATAHGPIAPQSPPCSPALRRRWWPRRCPISTG